MLTTLSIKNFTIIDNLDIEFQPGMTVLTGETGAGKSIIIDTLDLVLGGRTDNKIIRQNCERSEISAIFDLQKIPTAIKWLENHEFETNEECIIRRSINSDGRSRSTINGIPCPQQLTREFGALLLNIHGQHEHQSLAKTNKQLELLDNFAKHKKLCNEVRQNYLSLKETQTKLTELQKLTQNHTAKTELLNYQIKELDALALAKNELEELHQEYKQLSNAEQLLQNCNTALNIIADNQLPTAQNKLSDIKDINNNINSAHKLLNTAIIQVEEAALELRNYLDNINLNPERLQIAEQRLNTIYDIARKHRVKPEQLFELHQNLITQLQQLTNAENSLNELQHQITKLTYDYKDAASKLTTSRKIAAKKLSQEITQYMQQLNMLHGKFDIKFIPLNTESANGMEQIEFQVTTNPGQPLQPLTKVASGGELSRISLAIQVSFSEQDITPTLIFDEVDVGIGGKTAEIVGRLLKTLGNKTQIICVTHLPQVAAQGNHHFQISKETQQNTTSAQIKTLTKDDRIQEIARMLGGIKITDQTLAHAKEMCSGREEKNNI